MCADLSKCPGWSVLFCVWDCVGVSSSKCCRLLSKAKDERSNQHICKVLNEFQKLPPGSQRAVEKRYKICCQVSMQPSVRIFLHASAAIQRSGFTFFPQGRMKWLRCSQPRQLNPNEAALPGPSFLSCSGKANQTSQPSPIADI